MTTLPTREQIERAAPLEFSRPAEKQANIKISGELNGLAVEVEFTAPISSIPAAIDRLRAIGLSSAQRTMAPAPAGQQKKSTKVQPEYNDAGDPCCPKHKRALKAGNFGMYCSAKDDSTERGFCNLKFTD